MKRYCGRRFSGEEIGQLCALIATTRAARAPSCLDWRVDCSSGAKPTAVSRR